MDKNELKGYRDKLDVIDDKILKLYEERMDICRKIGEYKVEHAMSVYDPERETEVLEQVMNKVSNPEYADGAAQMFLSMMQASVEMQEALYEN